MKGAVATFVQSEIDINEFTASILPDGSLTTPIVFDKSTRLRMEALAHQDSLGSTTVEYRYRGITRVGPYPGQCLTLSINDDVRYQNYGFVEQETYIYPIAVTTLGVFIHDLSTPNKYTPQFLNDYQRAYDFYPWNAAVPFGDRLEEWTLSMIRVVTDGVATMTYTLTGSLHVGQTFTAGPVTFEDGFKPREMAIGLPWSPQADFIDFPLQMELLGARLILNDAVGATPTVTAFTVSPAAAFWNERIGYGASLEVLTMTGNVAGPQVINGYRASMWGTPNPIPLTGVFEPATPPTIEGIRNANHNNPAVPGPFTVYGWVSTDGLKVSARAEAESYAIDISLDGFYESSTDPVGHKYTVGQTAIVRGGVLALASPRPAQTVTWSVIEGGDEFFEIVGGVLRFKAAATFPSFPYTHPQNAWVVYILAEAEDGYNTTQNFTIYPV